LNNNKIVSSTKKTIVSLFLSVILVTGTIALSSSFMINAQAQPSYNNNYKSKDTNVNINKIKCINDNININGINSGDVDVCNKGADKGYLGAYSSGGSGYGIGGGYDGYYDGYKKKGKGFDDCVINNNNTNTNIVSVGGGNQTIPEPEPEPTTLATLTVNKEIFGCTNFPSGFEMECSQMTNTDPAWIPCTDPQISTSTACLELTANLFDIEVLDDQNSQIIPPFEGSTQGTTIENLQPGTYTVNEIKYPSNNNQLGESINDEITCGIKGFDDGGTLLKTTPTQQLSYIICIEYEDEQDNDCSTLTLAAGEDKTCTVKNYISSVFVPF
jgi:hypothetical protein